MSVPALRGAWAKVERAEQQIGLFDADIRRFVSTDPPPYEMPVERQLYCLEWIEQSLDTLQAWSVPTDLIKVENGRHFVLMITCGKFRVSLRILTPFPVLYWGAAIGEIVHDLRSALDCLTWELTVRHQRRIGVSPRTHPEKRWRNVAFPVSEVKTRASGTDRRPAWDHVGPHTLWGINKSVWAHFESVQPHTVGRRYKRHLLWVLHQLWNGDKHRSVSVVINVGVLTKITVEPGDDRPSTLAYLSDATTEMLSARSVGPLKDGAEMCTFLLRPDNPSRILDIRHPMKVNPQVGFQPRFQKSGPGQGELVFTVLRDLTAFVRAVLADFESEFR
jgi:hypothetical protein